jgi:hypothetical protein
MELPDAGPAKPGQAQCRCRFKVAFLQKIVIKWAQPPGSLVVFSSPFGRC